MAIYTNYYADTSTETAFSLIDPYLDGNYFTGQNPPIPGDDFLGNSPVNAVIDLTTMKVITRDIITGHEGTPQVLTINDILQAVEQANS